MKKIIVGLLAFGSIAVQAGTCELTPFSHGGALLGSYGTKTSISTNSFDECSEEAKVMIGMEFRSGAPSYVYSTKTVKVKYKDGHMNLKGEVN